MLHKEIVVALLLSCVFVFVLGNSSFILIACNDQEKEQASMNVCSNVTYAIGCLCLDDKQTYMLEFQSPEICEEVSEELTKQNVSGGVTECSRRQLQHQLNCAQLQWVCQVDGIVRGIYQPERDLCQTVIQTGFDCHRLECVTGPYHHICDNLTLVETLFDYLSRREETFNENQSYIVIFKKRHQCVRTANRISKDRFPKRFENAAGTLHDADCRGAEKILPCTLNLQGLHWVCNLSQVMRVTFAEKYLNESICRNVTEAQRLFFPNNTKLENFSVTYTRSNAEESCSWLVTNLTNPTSPDISATVYTDDCNATVSQFQGTLNYIAFTLVCSHANLTEANVVQVRRNVQPAEESTEEPTSGPTMDLGTVIGG